MRRKLPVESICVKETDVEKTSRPYILHTSVPYPLTERVLDLLESRKPGIRAILVRNKVTHGSLFFAPGHPEKRCRLDFPDLLAEDGPVFDTQLDDMETACVILERNPDVDLMIGSLPPMTTGRPEAVTAPADDSMGRNTPPRAESGRPWAARPADLLPGTKVLVAVDFLRSRGFLVGEGRHTAVRGNVVSREAYMITVALETGHSITLDIDVVLNHQVIWLAC